MQNTHYHLSKTYGSLMLFHYPYELPKKRFPRFKSCCFMLIKACGCCWPQGLEPEWIPAINDVEPSVTKSMQASDWHWYYATMCIYPARQTESGHLVVEIRPRESLYTLLSLITPSKPGSAVNASITAVYSLASMVSLTMYSRVGGRLKTVQTEYTAGQAEQSARGVLYSDVQSSCGPLTERSNWQKQQRYRCTIQQRQVSPATQPHEKNCARKTGYSTMSADKPRVDLSGEHLVGELGVLISPLYKNGWLALHTIYGELPHGLHKRTNRYVIFSNLHNVEDRLNGLRSAVSSTPSVSTSLSNGTDWSVLPYRSSASYSPDDWGQQVVPHEDDLAALQASIDTSYDKQSLQPKTMLRTAQKDSLRSTNHSLTRWQRDRGSRSQAELQGLAQVPASKNIGNSLPLFLKNRVRVSTHRAASWDTPGGRIEGKAALREVLAALWIILAANHWQGCGKPCVSVADRSQRHCRLSSPSPLNKHHHQQQQKHSSL